MATSFAICQFSLSQSKVPRQECNTLVTLNILNKNIIEISRREEYISFYPEIQGLSSIKNLILEQFKNC